MPPLRAEPFHTGHSAGAGLAGILAAALRRLCALLLLLVLSPVLLIIALCVLISDGPPILYKHFRVGLRGKIFRCYKFRTMRVDAEVQLLDLLQADPAAHQDWLSKHKLSNDPRITPVGRFLRKTSLDELPQLWNIIRGEMGFIGPRPVTVAELTRYGGDRWFYASVLPGVTGLWQVNGRNNTSYARRVALDRQYVESRTLWLDLQILLRTFWVVVKRDGAS